MLARRGGFLKSENRGGHPSIAAYLLLSIGREEEGRGGGGEREGEREGEKTDLFGGHLAFSQFRRLSMPIDVIRTKRGGYCESVFRRNA